MNRCALGLCLVGALGCRPGAGSEPGPRPTPAANEPAATAATPAMAGTLATAGPLEASASASEASSSAPEASASTAASASARAPRRAYVVAVMGDSLTDYASHGGGFIHVLERHCPKSRFDNYGKGGAMTNQMRRRFQAKVHAPTEPAYTHVIVFGGVNDLYSDITANRSNDKIEADLAQMYDWARQGGSKVVAISVTPWGGFRKYYNARRGENTRLLNAWMRDQVGARVDYFVDAYALLACGESLCPEYFEPFHDGIHFGSEGHDKLGEALWSQVFSDCL